MSEGINKYEEMIIRKEAKLEWWQSNKLCLDGHPSSILGWGALCFVY